MVNDIEKHMAVRSVRRNVIRILAVLLIMTVLACVPVTAGAQENTAAASGAENLPEAELTAENSTKLIAFTYDDGPSFATEALLDGLRDRGAYATFFMTGHLDDGNHGLEHYPELADRMVREGHQLANHSYYHINMGKATPEEVKTQIEHTEKLLFHRMGGAYIDMFRPPNGRVSTKQRKVLDVPVILWNYDSLDWLYINEDTVYRNLVKGASDGAIIDIHDLSPTSVDGSLRAVDTLKEQGYEFVTVAELLRRRGITPQSGQVYYSAPNKGTNLPAYTAPAVSYVRDYAAETTRVTFSLNQPGITLYYTTDGSYPTLASQKYEGPFDIAEDTAFTVVGYDAWGTRTPAAEQTVISRQTAVPKAIEENGQITLTCETKDAVLYYTTDGSEPTEDSAQYIAPFRAEGAESHTLKIMAARRDQRPSDVAVYALTDSGAVFSDLDISRWYFPYINASVDQKLMNGMGGQKFAPQGRMNRAMMVQILYNMEGRPGCSGKNNDNDAEGFVIDNDTVNDAAGTAVADDAAQEPDTFRFRDVTASDWFYDAVRWAASEGIVNGITETDFAPREDISREQLVTMMNRYAEKKGKALSEEAADLSGFPDAAEVHDYAGEPVRRAVACGLLRGYEDGTLRPRAPVTRAEAAAVLIRYIEKE